MNAGELNKGKAIREVRRTVGIGGAVSTEVPVDVI